MRMDAAQMARAIGAGRGMGLPWMKREMSRMPSHRMPAATMKRTRARRMVARVSYLPWPYSCCLSGFLRAIPTITSTIKSVMKSEKE